MDRVKRWWNGLSRRGKVITGVVVAVLLLGVLSPRQPDGTGAGTPTASPLAVVPSPTQASAASTGSSATPSAAPATPQTPAPTEAPSFDFDKPIPGLAAVGVTANLVDRGFDCGGMEQTDSGVMYQCTLSAPDAEQRVVVVGSTPGSITLVDSTALDFGPNPGDSAKAFLQYMATIPCEGCKPEEAKAWVRDNFDDGGEQVVGSVILVLYGDADSKILEIRAAP